MSVKNLITGQKFKTFATKGHKEQQKSLSFVFLHNLLCAVCPDSWAESCLPHLAAWWATCSAVGL
jgi:hypothetical protein